MLPRFVILALLTTSGLPAVGEETHRYSFEWSDPSRPGSVTGVVVNGTVTIQGHDLNEVLIEVEPRDVPASTASEGDPADGLKNLTPVGFEFSAHEDQNVVTLNARSAHRAVDIVLGLPRQTSVRLRCDAGGDIRVDGVWGLLDLTNKDGDVFIAGARGPLVAYVPNGDIVASFGASHFELPMSITSRNGNIDLQFPSDLGAVLKMRTDFGRIRTSYDLEMHEGPTEKRAGEAFIYLEKYTMATANEGGAEITVRNMNGDIIIRRHEGEDQ